MVRLKSIVSPTMKKNWKDEFFEVKINEIILKLPKKIIYDLLEREFDLIDQRLRKIEKKVF